MSYRPMDPLTDPPRQPDELRRLNLAQDSGGAAMRPWIVAAIAGIVVAMLLYGYTKSTSTTASAPPSSSSSTTTAVAPAPFPKANPFAARPSSTSAPDNKPSR
jgi:cell division protein FtsN